MMIFQKLYGEYIMSTGLVYDTNFSEHTNHESPESALRLENLFNHLRNNEIFESLKRIQIDTIPWDFVLSAHTKSYVEKVKNFSKNNKKRISFDTYLTTYAADSARLGASGAVASTKAVLEGMVDNSFSMMRPVGHHAHSTHAMGYCIFNNVAIAANYALQEHNLDKVMIIDLDAHHGNGTEQIFYASDDVLCVSFHQHPWFPGTGDSLRAGTEAGLGYNYNVAMPTWSDNYSYMKGFSEIVIPVAEKFKPEIILVAMGYDAHWMDHSSVLGLSVQGYYDLTKSIKDLAANICSGRLVFVLEGGYNLLATQECLVATFNALAGNSKLIDTYGLCPNKPVAAPDQTIIYLKGLIEFMHGANEKSFYDMPAEAPYKTE